MRWNPVTSKWCWYQLYAPCCGITAWHSCFLHCLIARPLPLSWSHAWPLCSSGWQPSLLLPGAKQGLPAYYGASKWVYALFSEAYRKKAIKCGKLCCGVIVTGIFHHFLGNHMTEGAKACGCSRDWCIASPDPHCLFVQRLVVSCYEWIIVLVSPVFMKDASGIAHGCYTICFLFTTFFQKQHSFGIIFSFLSFPLLPNPFSTDWSFVTVFSD